MCVNATDRQLYSVSLTPNYPIGANTRSNLKYNKGVARGLNPNYSILDLPAYPD